jgi:hypothetical protein
MNVVREEYHKHKLENKTITPVENLDEARKKLGSEIAAHSMAAMLMGIEMYVETRLSNISRCDYIILSVKEGIHELRAVHFYIDVDGKETK